MRSCSTALVMLIGAGLAAPLANAAPDCTAPTTIWGGFADPAGYTRDRDRDGRITIVAIGSSSTQGVGASAPANTYPAQLERVLDGRLPSLAIDVLNRGIGGDTAAANLARFDRDVVALRPDLVIWQVGTNDALTGVSGDLLRRQVLDGIARVRRAGAAVVLMDPQPLPDPRRERAVAAVELVLERTAREAGVPLLPRHALMRYWLTSGQFSATTLLGQDGLHMTDASYRCLAERVADLFQPATAAAGASTRGS